MKKGIFITFEGIDASGKTTQVKKTVGYLRKKGFDVLFLREPGGEPVSEQIRKILLKSKSVITPITELMLYLASRSQLIEKKIIPALKEKRVVICDRFSDSTLAYQGYGRGLDKIWIKNLNKKSTLGVQPDLTLLIDVTLEVYKKRAKLKKNKDRLEKENLAFYRKISKGYLEIARENKKRVKIVDGSGSIKKTWEKVKATIDSFLKIED
ncbi:MAG: dTMP kinase [Candidatus Zixiibacteriota bacterium]